MDNQKKVTCPCGKEMRLVECEGVIPAYRYIAHYQCDCGWASPVRDGTTKDEARENAYASATHREKTSDAHIINEDGLQGGCAGKHETR